jgi:hypothetical protein
METYAKCIHGHDETNRKRMDAAFNDESTRAMARRQGLEGEATENLARALATYDARSALSVLLQSTRLLMDEVGLTESDLPDDVRTALRQAKDVIGDV